MQSKYTIHPDFAKFPRLTLKFGALALFLINLLMKIQCFFVRRRLKLTIKNLPMQRADGGKIRAFSLTPPGISQPAPVLVYYHGGGFGITYSSLHLENCARYAEESACIIVFVDYRLAPKHPFPAGFDDCYAALAWTVENAGQLGADAKRIAVGGDSAGGALAAGVAQKARDENLVDLCGQLLVYPVLDNSCSTTSATEFTDVPLFNANSNRNMWNMYIQEGTQGTAPLYAAPGHGQLNALPRCYVETAEFDPLRDEGLKYSEDLRQHGVEVELNETRETIHGYDANSKSEITNRSMLARISFLKRVFSQ